MTYSRARSGHVARHCSQKSRLGSDPPVQTLLQIFKAPFHFGQVTDFSSSLKWVQFSSVAQSCLTLCDPMNCSTPGFPVITNRSLLKLMSIESVMPSNHLILCQAEVEAEVALVSCPEGHVYGKVAQGL